MACLGQECSLLSDRVLTRFWCSIACSNFDRPDFFAGVSSPGLSVLRSRTINKLGKGVQTSIWSYEVRSKMGNLLHQPSGLPILRVSCLGQKKRDGHTIITCPGPVNFYYFVSLPSKNSIIPPSEAKMKIDTAPGKGHQ